MTWLSRMSALVLMAALRLSASFVQAVDVWTVGVNNTRQGWNKFETVLTPANVPKLKKIREFIVDEKIDVSPLVVGDKLYVFTMTNTAYVFDVNTGAQLATPRQLAAPFDPADSPTRRQMDMDLHSIYRNWGITATPVIDVATNTLYVTTFGKPNANSPNTERNNLLWILDANTLADKKPPVLIAGNADNGGGGIANGFTAPYQKMRAGLGLLTDAGGNKAVVDLVLHQRREPARSGTRIRRRLRRARPQSRSRFHADAGDLERHAGRRRRRRVDVGLRAGDRRRRHLPRHRQRHGPRDDAPATSARASSSCATRPASPAWTTASRSSRLPTTGARSAISAARTKIRILARPASSSFPSAATSSAAARTAFSTT